MARKVDRNKALKAPPPGGADDLPILMPNVPLAIAGRKIVVREYGFSEGLRVRALMAPFTADLDREFASGREALVEDIMDLLGKHLERVQQAIAQSIAPAGEAAGPEDVAWVAGLGDRDGDLLINAWWGVNGLFFVRQVLRRNAERAKRAALAGATSLSNSASPSERDPSSSSATPSASSDSSTSD